MAADFDAGYGGRIELYSITINGGGGNPAAIDTTVKIESVISKDDFATETILAALDNIPVHVAADEAAALALVQDQTTLTGDLAALTATFPPSIPAVIVAEDYTINSRMTLADPLPAGSTVTIQITVNGAGPFPYVTAAPIPASPFWVTDLFDPAAVAADFDAGYGGRIELYSITITQRWRQPGGHRHDGEDRIDHLEGRFCDQDCPGAITSAGAYRLPTKLRPWRWCRTRPPSPGIWLR